MTNEQSQLTLDGLPDPPREGEWFQTRDDGRRLAVVVGVGMKGRSSPLLGFPIHEGDVVLEFAAGCYRVTSGGAFFWEKWRRADPSRVSVLEKAS